ncbi:16S rRNA (guanine(966)-N(2))-methyltransferase RsmD [Salinisphaera aquimarina]|uniref:Ribosomal RNA small subunit methyltransferase D n=1 Tax=Salinisphaera aquimarina TaxID=2094031 RepID=A0ABV7EMY1_9GAMM
MPSRRKPAGRGPASSVRIIGGEWRGRRLTITEAPGLRPTADRVRETLFNWLAPRLPGARCLDLFAGTGALGLEALSRGAAWVEFIETDRAAAQGIRDALTTLGAADRAAVRESDALTTPRTQAQGAAGTPDIIFIDPPFAASLHARALAAIQSIVTPETRIYLEYPLAEQALIESLLADRFTILRSKRAAGVGYCLARAAVDGEDGPS